MTYTIPSKNWGIVLINTIELARDDDVIIVHSSEMKELAERAKARMCPDKNITFEVEGEG